MLDEIKANDGSIKGEVKVGDGTHLKISDLLSLRKGSEKFYYGQDAPGIRKECSREIFLNLLVRH
jgi:hypothetical protein